MKPSAKQTKPFTKTISGLESISEHLDVRRASAGNSITKLFGRKREIASERHQELQAGLDRTYALKANNEAVNIRHTVQDSLPYVSITDSPSGKPEINYSISPSHDAPEPQTLTFEKQANGAYAMSLNHYLGGKVVADPIDFEELKGEQQEAITAMVSVINERYEQNPINFRVEPLPSPYTAE